MASRDLYHVGICTWIKKLFETLSKWYFMKKKYFFIFLNYFNILILKILFYYISN